MNVAKGTNKENRVQDGHHHHHNMTCPFLAYKKCSQKQTFDFLVNTLHSIAADKFYKCLKLRLKITHGIVNCGIYREIHNYLF